MGMLCRLRAEDVRPEIGGFYAPLRRPLDCSGTQRGDLPVPLGDLIDVSGGRAHLLGEGVYPV